MSRQTPQNFNSGKRLCVLQMHYPDAEPKLLETSSVPSLVDSGLFDEVILCVADVPENEILEPYARAWGIELVRGSERNVAARIAAAASERGATTIARALVWWFFMDMDLVARQLDLLEQSGADWVDLPRDFDLRFGVDAFSPRFLAKIEQAFQADESLCQRFGLNPWSFAEERPLGFQIVTCEEVPQLGVDAFEDTRARMRDLWPDRWDGAGTPLVPYRIACDLALKVSKERETEAQALDVASGLGAGTALLGRVAQATGIDLNQRAVEQCRERYGEVADFRQGNALGLDLPANAFDVVTSVHTLEHVEEEHTFLESIQRWLRPGGSLVLEVPFLARRPFLGLDRPLSPDHVREYDAKSLMELVGEHLEIVYSLGVARGAYVEMERARSAGLVVARKAS